MYKRDWVEFNTYTSFFCTIFGRDAFELGFFLMLFANASAALFIPSTLK